MKSTFSFIKEGGWLTMTIAVVVGVFAVVGLVQASTTISTNVNTGGTLTVSGQSTLATASSTGLTTTGGFWVNGTATTTATTGTITTAGNLVAVGTASSTNLIVGNGGSTMTHIAVGTCTTNSVSVSASSSAMATCSSATGVLTSDNVFVQSINTLPDNFVIQAASSSAADAIQIRVFNMPTTTGDSGADVTGARVLHFWAAY